ncbi:MAG: hypothetical protein JWM38_926 [Sphingomonas bacterium]|nr:hypothetical protein [Sphingomonas bacterium]
MVAFPLTRPLAISLAAIAAASATPATAASRFDVEISGGRLDRALESLARQAGIGVGGITPGMAGIAVRPLRGRMTVGQALSRMLRGTPLDYRFIDRRTVRLFARAVPTSVRSRAAPPPRVGVPHPASLPQRAGPLPVEDIVVTASKQATRLIDYPGTAAVLDVDDATGTAATRGVESLLARLPSTASTNLGTGRNKLFIRGIADSSFNGPTQSTIGYYLGDIRLSYSAPNPDVRLYDVERVEVLEGPQGTLYGAGALGGIVRILPRHPDPERTLATGWAGVTATAHGAAGHDIAAMVNLPLSQAISVRLVGYSQAEGGYIDDPSRKLSDINRVRVDGWRGAVRLEPGAGWSVELGTLAQFIETRDSQYALRGRPPLTRTNVLAQPYDLDVRAYSAAVRKRWDGVELLSATGLVRNDIDTRFDATRLSENGAPTAFDEARDVRLFSHETRLSSAGPGRLRWVAGLSVVANRDATVRTLGPPGTANAIADVRDKTSETALFGEASYPFSHSLSGTIGGRLVYTIKQGERETDTGPEIEPHRKDVRVLPTAAASWKPFAGGSVYFRYQEGFRAGGISVGDASAPEIRRFEPDELRTIEAGARYGGPGTRFSASAALFHTHWEGIQSDIIDATGFPRTINVGDGRVLGATAALNWRPIRLLGLDASVFINDSELSKLAPGVLLGDEAGLPNIAGLGARGAITLETPPGAFKAAARADLSYVGESHLGVDPRLTLDQGGYFVAGLSASVARGWWNLLVDVTNLFDSRANSFSFGNPFTVADGLQITPLRPRTVRLGLKLDL